MLQSGAAGTEVPPEIACWLKSRLQEELLKPHPTLECFMKYFLQKPWTPTPPHVKRCLPKEIELGVLQSGECLNYTWSNSLLLAEALAHGSCGESVTPCNDRMAFLGKHVVEALVVVLLRDPSFAKRLQFRGPQAVAWSPRGGGKTMELDTKPAEDTQKDLFAWRKACCNHLAYARTAVAPLSLHTRGLKPVNQDLKAGMIEFALLLQRLDAHSKTSAQNESFNPWPYIIKNGAPRALGDAFLAVAGAIYLDSSWRQAKKILRPILEKHIESCEPLVGMLLQCDQASVHTVGEDELEVDSLLHLLREVKEHKTLDRLAFAPGPDIDQVANAFQFNDFHVCRVYHSEETKFVQACSPRAAEIKACLIDALPRDDLPSLPEGEDDVNELCMVATSNNSHEGEDDVNESGGAIHCPFCDMWLNGPTQWEDHKIGKKHTKNINRSKAGQKSKAKAKAKAKAKDGKDTVGEDAGDPSSPGADPNANQHHPCAHYPYPSTSSPYGYPQLVSYSYCPPYNQYPFMTSYHDIIQHSDMIQHPPHPGPHAELQ